MAINGGTGRNPYRDVRSWRLASEPAGQFAVGASMLVAATENSCGFVALQACSRSDSNQQAFWKSQRPEVSDNAIKVL
jgi:hypothetical protein